MLGGKFTVGYTHGYWCLAASRPETETEYVNEPVLNINRSTFQAENIQHLTFNAQHRRARGREFIEGSMFP